MSAGTWSCSNIVVLTDLAAPPAGTPWVPGETRPFWVIEVSQPLAAAATTEDELALGDTKNAKRVIVTINGGGRVADSGGGVNRISITAGGTTRRVIEGSSMVGAPSFVEARSLCGGPMTLLIDESNSIGRPGSGGSVTNVNNVKQGARDFVNALAGTPVKLQIIGFHTFSHALGTTEWHRYFDMANDAEVAELLAAIDTLRFDWSGMSPNGGTNWEEGLFRAFYTEQGLTAEPIPNRVVFFTDGIPTFDRLVHRTGDLPADPPNPGPAWAASTGGAYSQVAFNRADFIAREFRGPIDLIGVGVGDIASGTENWVTSPRIGFRTVWYRSYRQYQQTQATTVYEKASTLASNLDFERYSSGSWGDTSPEDYFANNTVSSHTSQLPRGTTTTPRQSPDQHQQQLATERWQPVADGLVQPCGGQPESAVDPGTLVGVVPGGLVDGRPGPGGVQRRPGRREDGRPVAAAHGDHDDLGDEGAIRREQHHTRRLRWLDGAVGSRIRQLLLGHRLGGVARFAERHRQ